MRNVFVASGSLFLFFTTTSSLGQTPTPLPDSSGWGKSDGNHQRVRHQGLGFIGWSRGQARDSIRAKYVASRKLKHEFGQFYSNAGHKWFVLSTSFGEREGESRFITVPCPSMDSASFRDNFPYWQDRNGVYYARLSCHQQTVLAVPEADAATFRTLDFQRLAVDKKHVYESGNVVPGLLPLSLRVYTPNGERYGLPDVAGSEAYLVSGAFGYRPNGQALTKPEALNFHPSAPYKLAYPMLVQQPAKRR